MICVCHYYLLSVTVAHRSTGGKKIIVPFPPELLDESSPETQIQINTPSSTLGSDWLRMVNNEHLSDVQFHYKADCYHGHKIVLCAASELFRQIFETAGKIETRERLSWCETWSKKRLKAINKQCIKDGAVPAFKNVYDK